MVNFAVVSERMALINVDMQSRFVEGYPSSVPDELVVAERSRLGTHGRRVP